MSIVMEIVTAPFFEVVDFVLAAPPAAIVGVAVVIAALLVALA